MGFAVEGHRVKCREMAARTHSGCVLEMVIIFKTQKQKWLLASEYTCLLLEEGVCYYL